MIWWCPKCGVFGCGEKEKISNCSICDNNHGNCQNQQKNPPDDSIEIDYCNSCRASVSGPKRKDEFSYGIIAILRNHNEKKKTAVFMRPGSKI